MRIKYTFFALSALVLNQLRAGAQIVVNSGAAVTPAQLAAKLIDPSISYFNVTENCKPQSRGTFTGGIAIGIDEGVILTTGRAKTAGSLKGVEGPNTDNCNIRFNDMDETMNGGNTDQNLRTMTANALFDECVLEFDFIAENTELSIQYVFASEEYDYYIVSQTYSDAFGFFISGPGITVPAGYTGLNLAVIPGSSTYVSAFNLNKNNYPQYYISNCDAVKTRCSYNGLTTLLTAKATLQKGATYHVAIGIGDRGDGSMDSGVFVKAYGISFVVPLELIDFHTSRSANTTKLNWKTASELNNSHFEILHSKDGRNYKSIGTVKGVGSSSIIRSYEYTDEHPAEGTNYYRLKQFDVSGSYKYSAILKQDFSRKITTGKIIPNPLHTDIATVIVDVPFEMTATAQLFDLNNKVIFSKDFALIEGPTQLSLELPDLPPGFYTLRFIDKTNQVVSDAQKLVK